LENVKEIWDTLRIAHEGNLMTKVTKMEVIKDEQGRFAMKKGEGPQEMYNRLKFQVNQVYNYGSTRCTGHEVARLMLRSFTVFYANLVSLVRKNPRYTKMSLEEVLGKFVSHQMMAKNAKYIDTIGNGSLLANKSQVIAFKATNNKEVLPIKVAQVEATDLNDEEMTLVIKRFKNTIKGAGTSPIRANQGMRSPASSAIRMVMLLLTAPIMRMTRTRKRMSRGRR
jgi:hypothetical protein